MGEAISSRPGGGISAQRKRVSTGAVASQAGVDVTLVWNVPFSNNNYTVTASVISDVAGDGIRIIRVRTKTATQCVVHVHNSALSSQTAEVHAIAIAD